ncbi:MAG: T9SS type B sorting domain-containing protein [Bacteroidetes bacterium]|nr:T9SS type B sorting domain-containing protein [Bacteroidota bacterium]
MRKIYFLFFLLFFWFPKAQAQCNLTNPGLGLATCNDNGTPNDTSDDFYTFPLDPQGTGLGGGYTVTPSNGSISPPGSTYGGPTTFTLSGVPPGSGVSLIITDNDDPNCTTNTIINPPPCSPALPCSINFLLVGNITCSDNGTPNDASDDTFTVDVTVTGSGGSPSGWTASDPLNSSGLYDVLTVLGPYPISGGGFVLVATDNDDPGCTTIPVAIQPPPVCSASAPCSIDDSGLFSISCVTNGTPDTADDYVAFTLSPTGVNLGTLYSVSISPGSIVPLQGVYGATTSFFTEPGSGSSGDFTVTITDNDDPNCTFTFTLVNPCTGLCNISASATVPVCDDNGTPSDPSDDTFTFDVTVSGSNTGPGWSANDPNNTSGNYNVPTSFGPYPISGGPLNITIVDAIDPGCITAFAVNPPAPCSNACDLQQANLGNISCNDNGTPFDPSDDFIEFTLNPSGQGIAATYTVTSPSGPITPNGGAYGSPLVFQTSPGTAGNGPVQLTIIDGNDPACTLTISLSDPGVCSIPCDIDPILQTLECLDSGTSSIPGDDLFTATILVNGTGSGWVADDPGGSTGVFGEVVFIGPFAIVNGPVTLTFTSLDDPNCQEVLIIVPPPPCSNACILQNNVSNIQCGDNGTPGNTADDTYTFLLTVSGINAGPSWVAGPPANATGAYNVPTLIGPFSTAQPSISFTVSDINDPACNAVVTVTSPGSCSAGCTTVDSTLIDLASCNPLDTGVVIENFVTSEGCDSLVITTTSLLPGDTTQLFSESCNPQDTGTVEVLLINQFGCDSLVITTTDFALSDTTLLFNESCNPQDTGTIEVLLSNQFGCDSLVITTTDFALSDTTQLFSESCNPQDTGMVEVLLTNQFGCDSLVITTTSLLPSDTTQLFSESCNPQDTGTVEVLLANQFGCDSLVITTTSLLPSDTTQLFSESCNPQDTGTVEVLLANQFGCDSLVITTTSLLPSDTTQLFSESCNPQDTGTVEVLLTNQFGCDSLVITTTDFALSDTTQLFSESCNPQDTGTVEVLLINQFGCDSLVVTTTGLLPSDTTQLFSESCNPQDTGTVEVLLINQFGCDSLVITTTGLLPSDTTQLFSESCNPQDTGTVEVLLANQFGCDSLVITTTSLLPPSSTTVFPAVCFGESILINGTLYDASNPSGTDTLSAANGCDSLVFVELQISSPPVLLLLDTLLCAGESLLVNGQIYDESQPVGTEVISGQNGCDSLQIDVNLAFAELDFELEVSPPICEGLSGQIILESVAGGSEPFSYQINGQNPETLSGFPLILDGLFPGSYSLEISDENGCSETQEVFLLEGPEAILDLGEDLSLELGENATLQPFINFAYDSLIWSPLVVLDCENCLNPVVSSTEDVLISLQAISEEGCVAEDDILLTIAQNFAYYAPNAFSPNGDGINDNFTIFADNKQVLQIDRLSIFDRWGDQVFLATDIIPGDASQGWDGRFRGRMMNPGVFVYFAELLTVDGRIILIKGEISLIR